jgi:transglutaminase-like putative cysteine protease
VDDAVKFFSFGDPDKLIGADLSLVAADPPPHRWHGEPLLRLAWTDLAHPSIRYDVYVGRDGTPLTQATLVDTVDGARANVPVDGDGSYTVWVRPRTHQDGRVTSFGPFLVDASPPPVPLLSAPAAPPGYRFSLSWTESTDLSGIQAYELQRRRGTSGWTVVVQANVRDALEDQIGNGQYEYRVRAINGAGVPSPWSAGAAVLVQAPMQNPGAGRLTYGLHANYTGFLHLWDLSDPGRYVTVDQAPADVRAEYLGAEPAIETDNATLRAIVAGVVGNERNTLKIAEALFIYLFDAVDYDRDKSQDPDSRLQRAGETLDRGRGICGDLAVLYVTLLRIAGVPARPVHGYLDNALSGIGGFHMWVEVYVGPNSDARPWMTVDVSGVTGTFRPENLFPYFGIFNPDYLALGNEQNYDRFSDGQWNTWARFRYVSTPNNRPKIVDDTHVEDYESEHGRLFFDAETKRTAYKACVNPNPNRPEDPCPSESPLPGFSRYYGVKGLSKKRIDYGARLESPPPQCLKVDLRYPGTDTHGAVVADQSAIYQVYTTSTTGAVQVGAPDADGWVSFLDGTNVPSACNNL